MRLIGEGEQVDRRKHKRWVLPEHTARVRMRRYGCERYDMLGWLCDLSLGGARIELECAAPDCTQVEMMISFGNAPFGPICATGNIVRYCDPESDEIQVAVALTHMTESRNEMEFDRMMKRIILYLYDPHGVA